VHLKIVGGWPNCLRLFLRHFLMGNPGLMTSGIAIRVGGENIFVHAKLAAILADGDGHAKAFDWKGATSLKPCLRHYNVYKKVRLQILPVFVAVGCERLRR